MVSAWATASHATSPGTLRFSAGDVALGSDLALSDVPGTWQNFTSVWNSGSSTLLTLKIVKRSTVELGNDFALDDISVTEDIANPVPEPASIALFTAGIPVLCVAYLRRNRI